MDASTERRRRRLPRHGAPVERALYNDGHYSAFVLDPDGYRIELIEHS